MIVPMKKIYIVVQQGDREKALHRLRDVGTVHVEPFGETVDQTAEEMSVLLSELRKVLAILQPEQNEQEKDAHQRHCQDVAAAVRDVLRWEDQIAAIKEDVMKRQTVINRFEVWGDFDPVIIRGLKSRGVHVALCECPETVLEQLPEDAGVHIFDKTAGIVRCMVVTQGDAQLPIEPLPVPECSLHRMRAMQHRDERRIAEIQQRVTGSLKFYDSFIKAERVLCAQIRYKEVSNGMLEDESLLVLKGFCPEEVCPELIKLAVAETWGYLIEAPAEGDNIPTLLRNPRWVELVSPVFNLAGIIPDYRETDTSPLFMVFFSLFFAILIGDAGYGLIFLIATLLADRKFGAKTPDRKIFNLMYILSTATIVWGILTGVYFGQAWLAGIVPPLVPWLNDIRNMQMLCFLIGATHLSLAHIWRAVLIYPTLSFLSQVGWACLVWGMFFMARFLILGMPLNFVAKILFICGAFLVVFFTNPNKNPLKAMGGGLGDLAMNIVNSFSDIVSYIRLFAVGMATVAVADAFNSIAAGIGFNNVFTGLITALILVAGHLFNIVLGAMSILVHGLRLNLLEFSSHMGLSWAGFKYDPFRKQEIRAEK